MEEKTLSNDSSQQNIKNLIANIIKKQLGKKLQNLEQKNDFEIKEINSISKLSKELSKNLNTYSIKVNKKISENKCKANQRQIIANQNIRRYSPSNISIKMGKNRKLINYNQNHNYNYNINLKNNLMVKKSLTPIKNLDFIMKKNNKRHRKDINFDSKSINAYRRNNHKYDDNFDNQSKYSALSNNTNKKKNKTPVRKKNKIYIKKIANTVDKIIKKKPKIDFDLTSLDNDIELTKISINPDDNQERISNELYNITNARITIRLGALAEKIENEKLLIDDDAFFYTSDNFYKTIEYIFENLYSFLDIKSFFNIILLNKNYFNLMIKLIITKLENRVKDINKYLADLKTNNKSTNLKEEKIKQFEYNNSSIRALSILNTIPIEKFFSEKKINFRDKNISLIFDLYFISIGKKKDIINCNFEEGHREKYIMKYFKNNGKTNFGNVIDNELKKINFTDEIINALYEYSNDKLDIISPKNFHRVNKNVTWFCYLIKNIFEHIGIINKDNNNKNIKQIYNIYCSRLNINQELIKRLKVIHDLY
jgi:hypothetical protein